MYTKTQWVDNTTPIDKNNLNKIEQGIYDNSLVVDAVTNTLNPTDTETYKTAELTEGQITDVIGVNDIVIKGQTSQDGTPTPSAPIDINVVSGSNVIKTNNKNFFDKNTVVQGDWNNPSSSTSLVLYLGKISEGDKFTASNYNSRRFAFIISNMPIQSNQASALQSSGNQTATRSTFTATANGYVFFKITKTNGGNITPNEINSDDFQIEKGETSTSYVEHQGKKFTLNLGTIELCKIGNYQDYFYKSGRKWYLHKEINKITSYNGETITTSYISTTGELSTGAKVYYVVNSTNTEITDTTLISQLEAIYNAPLYEQTNITQENNDLPMVLDITACKDNINGIKAFIRK